MSSASSVVMRGRYLAFRRPVGTAFLSGPTGRNSIAVLSPQQLRFRSADRNSHASDSMVAKNEDLLWTAPASSSPSSPPPSPSSSSSFRPVYVHHVSRIALEHLQDNRHNWLVGMGLDRTLTVRPDGTFLLTFPTTRTAAGHDEGRIWTSYDSHRGQHWLSVFRHKLAVRFLLKENPPPQHESQQKLHQGGTLNCSSRTTNMSVASTSAFPTSGDSYTTSVYRIQAAVDEMIKTVDKIEEQQQQ